MSFYDVVNFFETFSTRLKKLREQKEISVSELANRVGINENTIKNYEAAISSPNAFVLYKICICLNTTPDYLLGFDGEEKCN
ncbi:MAG: helix-turn-helix domain-containing protein [Ruminiclostridium sp.]